MISSGCAPTGRRGSAGWRRIFGSPSGAMRAASSATAFVEPLRDIEAFEPERLKGEGQVFGGML
ncbi:hypothetical protein [Methylocystis heyeri]|uniref:hypothetical protein n=1 Tax=Methylocystis heyeri TaxID=391905 RepID=UPI0031B60FED